MVQKTVPYTYGYTIIGIAIRIWHVSYMYSMKYAYGTHNIWYITIVTYRLRSFFHQNGKSNPDTWWKGMGGVTE